MSDKQKKRQALEKKVADCRQALGDAEKALQTFCRDNPDALPKQASLSEIRAAQLKAEKAKATSKAKPSIEKTEDIKTENTQEAEA